MNNTTDLYHQVRHLSAGQRISECKGQIAHYAALLKYHKLTRTEQDSYEHAVAWWTGKLLELVND